MAAEDHVSIAYSEAEHSFFELVITSERNHNIFYSIVGRRKKHSLSVTCIPRLFSELKIVNNVFSLR